MTNNSALQFQNTVIAEVTKLVGTPIMAEGTYSQKAIFPLVPLAAPTDKGRRAYTAAFQIRFEDDAVVYLEMGNYAAMHGFYDDGTTATLTNVSAAIAVATAKALLGDMI